MKWTIEPPDVYNMQYIKDAQGYIIGSTVHGDGGFFWQSYDHKSKDESWSDVHGPEPTVMEAAERAVTDLVIRRMECESSTS